MIDASRGAEEADMKGSRTAAGPMYWFLGQDSE